MSAKRSDALLHKRENGYRSLSAEEKAAMNAYCEDYKTFLDKSRTEREAVRYTVQLAEARGYRPYHRGEALKPGDKVLSGQPRQGYHAGGHGLRIFGQGREHRCRPH